MSISQVSVDIAVRRVSIKQKMPFFKTPKYGPTRSRIIENQTKKNGLRHTVYITGDKYRGEWRDDQKCGKGVIMTKNNELYEGDMERNYRHGFGVLAQLVPNTKKYKLTYRGDWRNGKMHGHGLRVFPDGSFYLGTFRHGKRNGRGQMWWPDGGFFDGNFEDDMKDGLGVLVRADGNRYEGKFKRDKKHGEGMFWHLDSGQVQEGVWWEDMCVYSQLRDTSFKQCALAPPQYPMPFLLMRNPDEVCEQARKRALQGYLTCKDGDNYDMNFPDSFSNLVTTVGA